MTTSPSVQKQTQTVSLADEDAVKDILVSTVFGLWDIVNNLTRLRPSRPERYRVTIFGSARAQPGTYVYDEVKRVAAELAGMGCDIITGGGPGLMQAANEGAASANASERNRSVVHQDRCPDRRQDQPPPGDRGQPGQRRGRRNPADYYRHRGSDVRLLRRG